MTLQITVPSAGESIKEALLAQWYKQNGESVKKDEPLFVIETDKVTLEVVAEADGVLTIQTSAGETVAIGAVVGSIEPADPAAVVPSKSPEKAVQAPQASVSAPEPPKPVETVAAPSEPGSAPMVGPAVRRLLKQHHLTPDQLQGSGPGGRLTQGDVLLHLENRLTGQPASENAQPEASAASSPDTERKPMSPIRKRIAARLLEARQNTAMLTTFNEIDMGRAMALRSQYKAEFEKKHGARLGFMSFFIKACVDALQTWPEINAFIDGDDLIYHRHQHIGVAIGSERGLVVPVIRNADHLSFAGLEQAIVDYVDKIKSNRLELADLEGGTFTISNGGVYGSLLSTPILNTPQSAILGMHKIEKRPVVIDDEIVIRPMMYVALSYDHRIVDGKGAVSFLKQVKADIENPERMMMEI